MNEVTFSPSGRYACRKGERFDDDCSRDFVHIIDFEDETYIEVDAEGCDRFCMQYIYWLDDSHLGVIYQSYEDRDEEFMMRKKVLYEIDLEQRKLKMLKTIEWKSPMSVYLLPCEGTLTVNGQEYLVYENCGHPDVKEYDCFLHLIPKGFDNTEHIPEKVVLDWSPHEIATHLEDDCYSTTVAYKNTLVWTHNHSSQIISLNMDKYFSILKETGKPPAYADICSRIDVPMPKMWNLHSYVQNGFHYLIAAGEEYYGEHYLRVYDFETKQVTGLYKIEGIQDLDNTEDGRTHMPNWSIHPSGHLLLFQPETTKFHLNEEAQNGRPFDTYRERHLIKFLNLKIIPSEVESMKMFRKESILSKIVKYLSSCLPLRMFSKKVEPLTLERESLSVPPVDTSKLPRCLREGRYLLSLPLQTNRSEEELIEYFGS